MTMVYNLETGKEHAMYSCEARQAVIAAFAQDRNDYNTWDYDQRYSDLVTRGKWFWLCGKFAALHGGPYE